VIFVRFDQPVDTDISGFCGKLLFPNSGRSDKFAITSGWIWSRESLACSGTALRNVKYSPEARGLEAAWVDDRFGADFQADIAFCDQ